MAERAFNLSVRVERSRDMLALAPMSLDRLDSLGTGFARDERGVRHHG